MKKGIISRILSVALATAMVVTMLPASSMKASAAVSETKKLIDFNLISHDDFFDGGSNCIVDYAGTSFTASATRWGGDWGGDSLWQAQLKNLINVAAGQKYTITFTAQADKACTFKLKVGELSNGDITYIYDDISLEENTPLIYTKETTSAVTNEELMVLFALGGVENASEIKVSDFSIKGEDGKYIDVTPYINFEGVEHADFAEGVNINVDYSDTSIIASGNDWGNEWGADSKWQLQLKELVPVTTGEKYDFSVILSSEKAQNVFVKLGDANNDGTVFFEQSLSLKANEPYILSGTTSSEVSIENLMILFALGAESSEQNTIKISNLEIKGETSGWVIVKKPEGPIDTTSGKEYFDENGIAVDKSKDYTNQDIPNKEAYELIWADEFDGNYDNTANIDPETGLNLDNWFCQPGDGSIFSNPGWGNNELQSYTGRKENVGVNEDLDGDGNPNGLLRITAQYEADGYSYGGEANRNYTSARLATTTATNEALFTTTYGYIEASISLPETKGTWPAFWMLPQSTDIYGGWPVSGEIDIMETVGINTDKACGTLHWGAPVHVYEGSGYKALAAPISNFHTYAIDWEPGKITWYYDGVAINTLSNWESGISGASDGLAFDAPFDAPFYMLLNLAVDSGQFGGSANKATFDGAANMYVDFVRAYQKKDGYAPSAVRTASGELKDDWASYAGVNQIADITADVIAPELMGADADTDSTKWYQSYNANSTGGAAVYSTIKDDDNKDWAKVAISEAGTQDYSVQLIGHYDAKAGYVYQVSFDVYADGAMVGKEINCDSKEWSGWTTFGVKQFALSDSAEHITYLVDQKRDFDKTRIEFNLGAKATGNVYIGNVKVEIVDPDSIAHEEEVRKPLSNGDLIYNGTFDQGTDHFGYWTAAEGTTVSIPRYTTEKIADNDVKVVDIASKTNYEGIATGIKYYERRAQISAADKAPQIYQADLKMNADNYKVLFDLYSKTDTKVNIAVYNVNVEGETKTLGEKIVDTTVDYKAASGVKNIKNQFTLTENIDNAALVLTFEKGSEVQLDNVKLIGDNSAPKIDKTPIDADTTFTGDNGGGGAIALSNENGVYTANNLESGTNWYAPQFPSSDFELVAGNNYHLTFKYKLTGNTNNKLKYIIQENGGSWTVYNDSVKEVTYDASKADADGFCSYEVTFAANVSLPNVHLNFGLGSSEASGENSFSFKDVRMNLVEEEEPSDPIPVPTPSKPSPSTPSTSTPEKVETPVKEEVKQPVATKKPAVVTPVEPTKPEEKGEEETPVAPEPTKEEEAKEVLSNVLDLLGSGVELDADNAVVLKDNTVVNKEVFEAMAGKDVNVQFKLDNGVTWTINGSNMTAEELTNLDLNVTLGSDAIPDSAVEKVADGKPCINITLAHNGEFGFEAEILVPMGQEYAGMYANVYYYNPDTKELEFMGAYEVNEDGTANLKFTHASDYSIVMSDTPMEAVATASGVNVTAIIIVILAVLAIGGAVGYIVITKKRKETNN